MLIKTAEISWNQRFLCVFLTKKMHQQSLETRQFSRKEFEKTPLLQLSDVLEV